ncbi:hypothetical protein J6590_095224 [Homalodisca vitripennis]|nr:hypothetical protein J6590_095224 [Homalodisca vitripennis]
MADTPLTNQGDSVPWSEPLPGILSGIIGRRPCSSTGISGEDSVQCGLFVVLPRPPAVTPVRYAPITSRLSPPVVAASPCGSLHTASFPRRRYAILNLPYRRYRLVWWRCERVVLVTLFLLSRNWIVDVNNYYVIVRRQSNFTTAPQQLMARSILECTASAAVSCTGF